MDTFKNVRYIALSFFFSINICDAVFLPSSDANASVAIHRGHRVEYLSVVRNSPVQEGFPWFCYVLLGPMFHHFSAVFRTSGSFH